MRRAPELIVAAVLVAAITALYVLARPSTLSPGSSIGHALGIVGVLLMLATEVLYSIRKRARDRAWGPMSIWLRVHIVCGIVGPFLIALHTTGHLHGAGGWAAIATAVVVASGFTGRYLYTAIPRAAGGNELTPVEIEAALSNAELRLSSADLVGRARKRLDRDAARLRRRSRTAARMRRLLSGWHTIHVPLSLALFTLVAIHIAISLFFGAGMR
ncbi:MAG TPA: hypothetical protein VLT45_09385 [Kofleriaceae bacterium]|nr:hypothetical protein [Kofleriaceae bacterium]